MAEKETESLVDGLLKLFGDSKTGKHLLSEMLAEMVLDLDVEAPNQRKFVSEPPESLLTVINGAREKLKETEAAHALAEKRLNKHDWLDWYSAYMGARASGVGPKSAALTADMYINWLMDKVAKAEKAETEKQMDAGE